MAVKLEKNGEAVYREAIARASNARMVALLGWMADEEARHAQWFGELKGRLKTDPRNAFMKEMSRELFDDLLGEKNFSLQDVDFGSIDQVNEMLNVFIEFEKDTVIFYQVLEPFISDTATLEVLRQIIAEEKRHIEQLQELLQTRTTLSSPAD